MKWVESDLLPDGGVYLTTAIPIFDKMVKKSPPSPKRKRQNNNNKRRRQEDRSKDLPPFGPPYQV